MKTAFDCHEFRHRLLVTGWFFAASVLSAAEAPAPQPLPPELQPYAALVVEGQRSLPAAETAGWHTVWDGQFAPGQSNGWELVRSPGWQPSVETRRVNEREVLALIARPDQAAVLAAGPPVTGAVIVEIVNQREAD